MDDGTSLDLSSVIEYICSDLQRLQEVSEDHLRTAVLWRLAAQNSVKMYAGTLASIRLVEGSNFIQEQMTVSDIQLQLATRGALLIIWGITHYLEWASFNIQNPTKSIEISAKLGFIRKPVFELSIGLAKSDAYAAVDEKELFSGKISRNLKDYYERCFGIGATIGYVMASVHSNGFVSAQHIMTRDKGVLK